VINNFGEANVYGEVLQIDTGEPKTFRRGSQLVAGGFYRHQEDGTKAKWCRKLMKVLVPKGRLEPPIF
jgi:hypothetical protein